MEMVWFWSGNEAKSAGFDGLAADIAGNSSNCIGNSKVFGNNPHGGSSPPVPRGLNRTNAAVKDSESATDAMPFDGRFKMMGRPGHGLEN
jgi:hypothetical protein